MAEVVDSWIETVPYTDPMKFFDPNDLPSFVVRRGNETDFFAAEPTGEGEADLNIGTALAVEAMFYARKVQNSACILYALHAIMQRGHMGLLEAGFISRISDAARMGSMD